MKTNIEVRNAAHPDDVKHWDTGRLRKEHLVQPLFVDDRVTHRDTAYLDEEQ